MRYGVVLTRGSKAAAIRSGAAQFYAPLEACDVDVFEYDRAVVCFEVDTSRYEGRTAHGRRYYAYNVRLFYL